MQFIQSSIIKKY